MNRQRATGWSRASGAELPDPASTAYCLSLLDPVAPGAYRSRFAALARDDGGFASPPHTAGSRPIPYDVPVLANCYVLLALQHARQPAPVGRSTRSRAPWRATFESPPPTS